VAALRGVRGAVHPPRARARCVGAPLPKPGRALHGPAAARGHQARPTSCTTPQVRELYKTCLLVNDGRLILHGASSEPGLVDSGARDGPATAGPGKREQAAARTAS
jgi:hypothetical protein